MSYIGSAKTEQKQALKANTSFSFFFATVGGHMGSKDVEQFAMSPCDVCRSCLRLGRVPVRLRDGEKRIIYAATGGAEPGAGMVVASYGADALAKPVRFECAWTDYGTGTGHDDGSFWKAIAPEGYVALSHVAVHMENKFKPGSHKHPDEIDPDFRCVHRSLAELADLGPELWTDRGSRGNYNGRVHGIRGSQGCIVSTNHRRDMPPATQHKLSAIVPKLYRDLEEVTGLGNSSGTTVPVEYNMQVGLTIHDTTMQQESDEYTQKIATTVRAGITDVAQTELTTEIGETQVRGKSISHSTVTAASQSVKVTFNVRPNMYTKLCQLVVLDSADGIKESTEASALKLLLRTSQYFVIEEALPVSIPAGSDTSDQSDESDEV